MKKLKMIYKWILISVILQTAVLAYLEFIYLPNRGHFRTTMYETEMPSVKDRSIILPEGATGISVSYDGLYAAYKLGNNLVIVDIDSKKTIKEIGPTGGEFTYFGWLPDREMLIYSEKEPEGKTSCVRISTFDIVPELDRSYPDIKKLPEGSGVIDIELSPLTNIVYPVIKTSDTRARIYKFDIMDNLNLIFKTDLTTIVKETMYTDNLIYQLAGERICIRNGKTGKVTHVPVKEANLLLDVDDNDYIYAAETDESGKAISVYYGKAGTKDDQWEKIPLAQAVLPEDIIITAEGNVFAADRKLKKIQCLKGSYRSAKYDGELVTVLDSYIVTTDKNRLLLKTLE